jgi:hypothetical protein
MSTMVVGASGSHRDFGLEAGNVVLTLRYCAWVALLKAIEELRATETKVRQISTTNARVAPKHHAAALQTDREQA